MDAPSRRALLAGATASALSGCFSSSTDPKGSKLGAILVANMHEESHTIDLKVEWEGEVVHDQSYDLPADTPESRIMESTIAEPTWPKEAGNFALSARADGDPWWEVTPADHGYPECFAPNAMVDEWGVFGIGVLTTSKRCTQRDQYPLNESPESEPRTNDSVGNSSDAGE